jgi:hypothetical protein
MAFRGKNSKKDSLDKGVDTLGRVNYYSRGRRSRPLTQQEAKPLSGAVTNMAAPPLAFNPERARQRLQSWVDNGGKAVAERKMSEEVEGTFGVPAEVTVEPGLAAVEEGQGVDGENVKTYSVWGRARLRGASRTVELDVERANVFHGENLESETRFYFKGQRVKDSSELLAAVLKDG